MGLLSKIKERFGPTQYTKPEGQTPKEERIRNAIAQNETSIIPEGEKYTFRKSAGAGTPNNEDLGKYQVTSDELATYAKRYLGRDISPNAFIKDSNAQEVYMSNKVQRFLDEGYDPEQIADIRRRGFTKSSDPGSTVYQDPDYVKKFRKSFYPWVK